jgi:surface protein
MFYNCSSLKSVPLFSTASVTDMSSMFAGCTSLKTVPLFNTDSVTNMTQMFQNCVSLKSVPLFNTASVTSMSSMFYGCISLESVPLFNTASVVSTGFSGFAAYSLSLKSLTISTAGHTSASSLLQSNSTFPSLSGGSPFGFSGSSTRAIKNISVNCSGVTSAPTIGPFSSSGFTNVTSIIMTGMKYAFSVQGMRLDGTALDALYTSLGTAAGAQTLTVTTNHGTVGDTPSIATTKGWTVTGS